MALQPITIRIVATGGVAAAAQFRQVAAAGQQAGRSLQSTSQASRAAGQGIAGAAKSSAAASNQIVNHAARIAAALRGVGHAAGAMGSQIHSGATSGAGAMDALTNKVLRLNTALEKAKEQGKRFSEVQEALGKARNVGLGMIGAGVAGTYAAGKGVMMAATMQTQLKSIEALSGSRATAQRTFREVDAMSTSSTFDLTDLVGGAKRLTASGLYSQRNIKATDDLAAVYKDEGVKPVDVARAMGRLKAMDFGEGFERLRDFGINRPMLEAKGLKFSSSNEYEDKTPEGANKAIEAVVSIIEERFGGLSEKLATETLEGALSNLNDAFGRMARGIFENLVPAVTTITKLLTKTADVINALPQPIKSFLAWATVLGIGITTLGGIALATAAQIGLARIALMGLGVPLGGVGGMFTNLISKITGAGGIGGLASSLSGVLLPALGAMALAAIAAAATIKAIEWTKEAQTKSDEEMEGPDASMRQRSVSRVGRWLGTSKFGMMMEGGGWNHGARGDDAEAKSAAIFAQMRKKAPYNPALNRPISSPTTTANTAAAIHASNTGALPNTATQSTFVSGDGGGSVDALQEQLMLSEDKSERKALQRQLFYARRAAKNSRAQAQIVKALEREEKRLAKTLQRQQDKIIKAAQKRADKMADADADIITAQIEEYYETEIAKLEAQRDGSNDAGINYKIARKNAEKTRRVGSVRNESEDDVSFRRKQIIANTRASGMEARAQIAYDAEKRGKRGSLAAELAAKGVLGSYDYTPQATMFNPYAAGNDKYAQAAKESGIVAFSRSGVVGVPSMTDNPYTEATAQKKQREYTARGRRLHNSPMGNIVIKFDPIEIPDSFHQAAEYLD